MGFDNPLHIIFLLIVLLLVFGAKRLPEMGRSLGEGMRGFKDSISGEGANTPLSTPAPEQPVAQAQPAQVHPLVSEPVVSAEEQADVSTPRAA